MVPFSSATAEPRITVLATRRAVSTPTPFGDGVAVTLAYVAPVNISTSTQGREAVARGNQIYIDNAPISLSFSPGGLREGRAIRQIEWSPDGRYIAFTITGNASNDFYNQFYDYGVWIYDTWDGSSDKLLHEDDRKAIRIDWSPNSMNLLVQFEDTSEGGIDREYVIVPVEPPWNPDFWYDIAHRYSDASWGLDSRYVYVSGFDATGTSVLGRIDLTADQRFEAIPFTDLSHVRAATEVQENRLMFLGGGGSRGPFFLYSTWIGAAPQRLSARSVSGLLVDWDWNDERTALLVTMEDSFGQRQSWAFDQYGNLTPLSTTGNLHWR